MPSFGFLATLTTLAFAAFSSAAPSTYGVPHEVDVAEITSIANVHAHDINAANVHHVRDIPDADVVGPAQKIATALTEMHTEGHERRSGCNGGCGSLPAVVVDLKAKVAPACNKLSALVSADITLEVVAPLCKQISDAVIAATVEVKLLVGKPSNVLLSLDGKVLALVDLANLLGELLCLIFGALAVVIKVCATVKLTVILPLLTAVGLLVADLCAAIFLCVPGLVALVLGVICKIIPALFHLRLYAFISLLGL
ncbi:hypothetical protein ONZ45_g12067 [Pleurotus djamor]|nr:hypothetical protein ONZ45_g12067 [Pleurotus djamor]